MSMHPADRENLRPRVEFSLSRFLLDRRAHMTSIDSSLSMVADTMDAFVASGKRLRPAFAYWGYRGAGGADRDDVVRAVAALELVQASALMHDDLMDGSETRRGEPAVHRRFREQHLRAGWRSDPDNYGMASAILLGDLCLVWSDELFGMSGLDPVTVARARPVFDLMRSEVMLGQYLDVLTQASADTSVERASQVARFKSAKYTVEHPLLLGAALADATPEIRTSYSRFGLPLGEAFQLRDDVLGVFGDPAVTGKPAGDDLREGKRTYLVATAFARIDEPARAALTARLGDPALDAEGVAQLREIILGSGALAATEERIEELATGALAILDSVELAGDAGKVLRELAEVSVHRTT
jgi:geranylgeranyl diphosphate synthase, type I